MKKYAIAVLIVAGFAAPALAASNYFVAQNSTTHKCSVVDRKPDGKSLIQISTSSYKSKSDAMKAMKDLSECKA
jgi:hypothetical protein